jgi:two-component system chemotaxis response regulator CheY
MSAAALRIMVVEDNLFARDVLKEMIAVLGHQVVAEADNLSDTLAACRQHHPDLAVIDLSLPKEDGLTILRCLRRDHPGVRAVIVSGNSQAGIRDEVLKAGAVDLLGKPVAIDSLRGCLEKITANGNNPPGQ